MIWQSRTTKALMASFAECEHLREQLEMERTKRIHAEMLAVERAEEVKRAWAQADRLETALRETIKERLRSLDAVNVALLQSATGEIERSTPPVKPGDGILIETPQNRASNSLSRSKGKFIEAALKRQQPAKPIQ